MNIIKLRLDKWNKSTQKNRDANEATTQRNEEEKKNNDNKEIGKWNRKHQSTKNWNLNKALKWHRQIELAMLLFFGLPKNTIRCSFCVLIHCAKLFFTEIRVVVPAVLPCNLWPVLYIIFSFFCFCFCFGCNEKWKPTSNFPVA